MKAMLRGVAAVAGTCVSIGSAMAWPDGPSYFEVNPGAGSSAWSIGRIQGPGSILQNHSRTGTYVLGGLDIDNNAAGSRGYVLTCSHGSNEQRDAANSPFYLFNTFERFAFDDPVIGQTRRLGLALQHPNFSSASLSDDDIGIILLLNAPGRPANNPFYSLGGQGGTNDELDALQNAQIRGYSNAANGSVLGAVTVAMRNNAIVGTGPGADRTANLYIFRVPPSQGWVLPGDSGGPTIYDFGDARGERIVGVNRSTVVGSRSDVVRVDSHLAFARGDGGLNGQGRLFFVRGAENGDFADADFWRAGSALAHNAPALAGVAVLDPTANSDRGSVVTVNASTDNLYGLLNDMDLRVQQGNLNVFAGPNNQRSAGVLNGGRIAVGGGANNAGLYTTSYENAGQLDIMSRGFVTLGLSYNNAHPDEVIFFNSRSVGDGFPGELTPDALIGRVTVRGTDTASAFLDCTGLGRNQGVIDVQQYSSVKFGSGQPDAFLVNNATVNSFWNDGVNASLTIAGPFAGVSVTGNTFNTGNITVNGGGTFSTGENVAADDPNAFRIGLNNTRNITINAGGSLRVHNLVRNSAALYNSPTGRVIANGAPNALTVFETDYVSNDGFISLNEGILGSTSRTFYNNAGGRLSVGVAAGDFTSFRVSQLQNADSTAALAGGSVTIENRGSIRMDRNNPPADPAVPTLYNGVGATFTVRGGSASVNGGVYNGGAINLIATDTSFAFFTVDGPSRAAPSTFDHQGSIVGSDFNGTLPRLVLTNCNFVNRGSITGPANFIFAQNSSWDTRRAAGVGAGNYNQLDFRFDFAYPNNTDPTTMDLMEIMSIDNGAVEAGLDQQFAIHSLCVRGNSRVQLVDGYHNEQPANVAEVLYTRMLGVAAGSILDLGGLTLYYLEVDPDCLLEGTVRNGNLVQIPVPGGVIIVAIGAGAFGTRRRRAMVGAN